MIDDTPDSTHHRFSFRVELFIESRNKSMHPEKTTILNAQINNITTSELLQQFDRGVLVTPNIDHLMRLQKDRRFYECYQRARFVVCDSRIIYLLSKCLFPKKSLKAQITGSDFFPAFCQYHADQPAGTKVFLLGGSEESVKLAAANINQKTQSEIVVGYYSPPFGFEHSKEECSRIINVIRESGATALAVGVGSPKQEFWIFNHMDQLPDIRMFLAIGATIEFEAGTLTRAPKWMTNCGLEWLYRLLQEPKRLAKRYLVDGTPFFYLLLKQRLGLYKNPWG